LSSVGNVHRAVKTPVTIQREIANGEKPAVTSFVGASADPSHTPAVKPQMTPRPWSERRFFPELLTDVPLLPETRNRVFICLRMPYLDF
jgi:hypothetical protein